MRGSRAGVGVLMVPLVLVAGCSGTSGRATDASVSAAAFERALESGDVGAACAVLAPQTLSEVEQSGDGACVKALPGEKLPAGGAVGAVRVYGSQAQVVLASDTLFLSHFADGWKVVAAGCRPQGDQPYQCAVQGG
jgi:hypothetical protein